MTLLQEVLNKALKPEHLKAGFVLTEPDDHALFLTRNNIVIAVFSAHSATYEEIWKAADKAINEPTK